MRSSAEAVLHGHMGGLVWFMEIFSVAFVLAVFVFYFILKRRIKKRKAAAAESQGKKASGELPHEP